MQPSFPLMKSFILHGGPKENSLALPWKWLWILVFSEFMVYFLCGNVRAWFFKLLFLLRSKMCINKKSRLKLNGSTRKHLAKGPHTAKTEPAQQRRYKQQKEEASTYNAINMDSHFGIHTIFWDTVMKMGEIARTFFFSEKVTIQSLS